MVSDGFWSLQIDGPMDSFWSILNSSPPWCPLVPAPLEAGGNPDQPPKSSPRWHSIRDVRFWIFYTAKMWSDWFDIRFNPSHETQYPIFCWLTHVLSDGWLKNSPVCSSLGIISSIIIIIRMLPLLIIIAIMTITITTIMITILLITILIMVIKRMDTNGMIYSSVIGGASDTHETTNPSNTGQTRWDFSIPHGYHDIPTVWSGSYEKTP